MDDMVTAVPVEVGSEGSVLVSRSELSFLLGPDVAGASSWPALAAVLNLPELPSAAVTAVAESLLVRGALEVGDNGEVSLGLEAAIPVAVLGSVTWCVRVDAVSDPSVSFRLLADGTSLALLQPVNLGVYGLTVFGSGEHLNDHLARRLPDLRWTLTEEITAGAVDAETDHENLESREVLEALAHVARTAAAAG